MYLRHACLLIDDILSGFQLRLMAVKMVEAIVFLGPYRKIKYSNVKE